jgi:hypothetical protein
MTKKRLILIGCILLALIILFFIFRAVVENTLGRKIGDAVDQFWQGVGSQSSIAENLEARLLASDGLQNIAAKYDQVYEEYSALRTTRNDLFALFSARSGDLGRMFDLNADLTRHFAACREALEPITEGKAHAALAEYQDAMDTAQAAIDRSAYNDAVRDFRRDVLDRFPASLLKGLVKEEPPALWESAGG